MSALAMILTAAIAVPGDVPEMVPGEMVQEPQPLVLRGEWQGIWYNADGRNHVAVVRPYRPNWISATCGAGYPFVCYMDGPGAFRGEIFGKKVLGIFRQESDRLTLCFREVGKGRPIVFRRSDEQHLIIIRCVKPAK